MASIFIDGNPSEFEAALFKLSLQELQILRQQLKEALLNSKSSNEENLISNFESIILHIDQERGIIKDRTSQSRSGL